MNACTPFYGLAILKPLIPAQIPIIVIKVEDSSKMVRMSRITLLEPEEARQIMSQIRSRPAFKEFTLAGGLMAVLYPQNEAQVELAMLINAATAEEVDPFLVVLKNVT
jgi:hypothetical protein